MRIRCTESFNTEPVDAEATFRVVRKIVDDRLAEEVLRRLGQERQQRNIEIA